jgi:hypothetical protein
MEFGKLQSLVELDLSNYSKLGCLPDSIVDLSQLKTFRSWQCYKLENLPVEFRKLQSLVELDSLLEILSFVTSHYATCMQLIIICNYLSHVCNYKFGIV